MMSPELVSVIVPMYNTELYMEEMLNSVLAQKHDQFELILIDDGSTDNTHAIAEKYAANDNRIRLYSQRNQGVSAARNYGYSKSQGNLVAFLDADDVWLPDNLSEKIAKIRSGDFGLVHSDAGIIEHTTRTESIIRGKEGMLLEDLLSWEGPHIPGPSSILVKRAVVEEIGLFDEGLSTSADLDFFIRIAAKYKIGRVPKVTWYYRIHPNNMHKGIKSMERDMLRVFEKASANSYFENDQFRRYCYSKMHLILALSWFGDGKDYLRFGSNFFRSLFYNPKTIFTYLAKKMTK